MRKFRQFISIASCFFISQPALPFGVTSGSFAEDADSFVCDDETFLLSKPDRAMQIKPLQIGDAIHIFEKSKETDTIHGFKDNFYRVKIGEECGYVWGGNIAKAYIRLNGGITPELLLVKIDGIANGASEHIVVVEVVKLGKVISRCHFRAIETSDSEAYGYTLKIEALNQQFSGGPRLFRLDQQYQACDYSSGSSILVLTGERIRHALDAVSQGNEQGSRTFDIVGPNESGGSPDVLAVNFRTALQGSKHNRVWSETYKWNGTFFVPLTKSKFKDSRAKLWDDNPAMGGAF